MKEYIVRINDPYRVEAATLKEFILECIEFGIRFHIAEIYATYDPKDEEFDKSLQNLRNIYVTEANYKNVTFLLLKYPSVANVMSHENLDEIHNQIRDRTTQRETRRNSFFKRP